MHAITRPDIPAAFDTVDEHDPDELAALHVQRATLELRAGRDVEIQAEGERLVITALERRDPAALDQLASAGRGLTLLLSPERASVLGHAGGTLAVRARLQATVPPASVGGPGGHAAWRIAGLSAPESLPDDAVTLTDAAGGAPAAALELARQARLQPALLIRRTSVVGRQAHRLAISAQAVLDYRSARGRLLERTGSATVQLERTPEAVFTAYRERFGDGEHAAVMIGAPDLSQPVLVRVHSSCFTGDLFGSLRCDCGDQLDGAVDYLADHGGGVVLYLAQEGRGIGLGNKLRAYRMQAAGFDTIEADRRLGFGPDGRDFSAARTMLADLGIERVRLLTNNPAKVAALQGDGLQVVERLPLSGNINAHNHRYLETKRARGGHLASVLAGGREALPAAGRSSEDASDAAAGTSVAVAPISASRS